MSDDALTLTVPPDLARALRDAVEAGEYPTVDHALADALQTWARRHEDRAEDLAWMKAKIRASLLDPSPSLSSEEVDRRLDAFYAAAEREADEAA